MTKRSVCPRCKLDISHISNLSCQELLSRILTWHKIVGLLLARRLLKNSGRYKNDYMFCILKAPDPRRAKKEDIAFYAFEIIGGLLEWSFWLPTFDCVYNHCYAFLLMEKLGLKDLSELRNLARQSVYWLFFHEPQRLYETPEGAEKHIHFTSGFELPIWPELSMTFMSKVKIIMKSVGHGDCSAKLGIAGFMMQDERGSLRVLWGCPQCGMPGSYYFWPREPHLDENLSNELLGIILHLADDSLDEEKLKKLDKLLMYEWKELFEKMDIVGRDALRALEESTSAFNREVVPLLLTIKLSSRRLYQELLKKLVMLFETIEMCWLNTVKPKSLITESLKIYKAWLLLLKQMILNELTSDDLSFMAKHAKTRELADELRQSAEARAILEEPSKRMSSDAEGCNITENLSEVSAFWKAVLRLWGIRLFRTSLIMRALGLNGLEQLARDLLSWFKKKGITAPSERDFLACLESIIILDCLDYGRYKETDCYRILSERSENAYNLILAALLVRGEEYVKNSMTKTLGDVLLTAEDTLKQRGLTDEEIMMLKHKAKKCLELAGEARSEAAKEYAQRIRIKPIDWRKLLSV